jgi:hypothetical protein
VLINIALQVSKKLNLTAEELSSKLYFDGLRGLVTPHLESNGQFLFSFCCDLSLISISIKTLIILCRWVWIMHHTPQGLRPVSRPCSIVVSRAAPLGDKLNNLILDKGTYLFFRMLVAIEWSILSVAITSTLMNILDLLYFFEKMRGQWEFSFHAVVHRM